MTYTPDTYSVTRILNDIYPFDEASKRVWLDNTNQELAELGKPMMGYEELMELTQRVGDMIHTFFLSEVMGFPNAPLPPELISYQLAIESFLNSPENEIIWHLCEFTIEKPWEYTGHPDLLCTFNGKKALVDVKTYQAYRTYLGLPIKPPKAKLAGNAKKVGLQLSMYRDAMNYSHPEHFDANTLLCFHVKDTEVEAHEVKYDILPYLKFLSSKK